MTDELLDIKKPIPDITQVMGKKIPIEGIGLPESQTRYIVLSYLTTGGYWSYKGMWTTKEAAIQAAQKMSKCWNYHRLIEVEVP